MGMMKIKKYSILPKIVLYHPLYPINSMNTKVSLIKEYG